MAAPQWTDAGVIPGLSLQTLAKGAVARGVLNCQNIYGARIFLRTMRANTTAPAVGVIAMVRVLPWDTVNLRYIPHPIQQWAFQEGAIGTAANSTTLSANPSGGATFSGTLTVTGVSTASSPNPAVITTSANHNLQVGDAVTIASCGGTTNVNVTANVNSVPSATTFTIQQAGTPIYTTGQTYTSGGTVTVLNLVTVTSNTGFTTPPYFCAITNSLSSPTWAEWCRASAYGVSTVAMDWPLQQTSIASGSAITTLPNLWTPSWVDGVPSNYGIQVLFDYGAETAAATLIIEARAQTLTSIQ